MLEFIKSRRSTRKFIQDRDVSFELIEKVVEAGRYAPSGGNSQTTHFMVITNKEVLNSLAVVAKEEFAKMEIDENTYKSLANSIRASKTGNYIFHYKCPVLILTANKKDYGNNMADCACALENMMLEANALDLGTVWINQLKWLNENERILDILKPLGLQEDERVYGGIALGYPDSEDGLPNRTPAPRHGNPVTYVK